MYTFSSSSSSSSSAVLYAFFHQLPPPPLLLLTAKQLAFYTHHQRSVGRFAAIDGTDWCEKSEGSKKLSNLMEFSIPPFIGQRTNHNAYCSRNTPARIDRLHDWCIYGWQGDADGRGFKSHRRQPQLLCFWNGWKTYVTGRNTFVITDERVGDGYPTAFSLGLQLSLSINRQPRGEGFLEAAASQPAAAAGSFLIRMGAQRVEAREREGRGERG